MLTNPLLTSLLCSLLLLQACAPTLPDLKKPKALPKDYAGTAHSSGVSAQISWKEFFKDPRLEALIDEALKNNQELKIIEQEINIASNEVLARQGEYLPKFSAQADGGVEKTQRFSTKEMNEPIQFGRAGLVASWELDIWGRLRNAAKAANMNYLASIEGQRFMVTNLVSEIALSYYELLALDNQLEIVKNYIELLKKIRTFTELQQQAGRITSLPVKRFEAEVLKNQSKLFELKQRLTVTENRLNTLLGRFPHELQRNARDFKDFTLSSVSTSVPSKLLENRPDLRRAALNLESAKINVDVARKRFYPSLSIEAGAGYESFNASHINEPHAAFFGLIGNLTAPLINRRAIEADYLTANNKQIQAVYEYEQTLVRAYAEVTNQLAMVENYNQIYESKRQQVKALNESIEISNVLFKAARVDYVESLLTQRDALEAEVELFEVKKDQLAAYVGLYKALGGGWREAK